ncbi:hypothetical protein [Streptomonospora litoralis]|uniref:hypothetical protein n=1 Tax=Streptomonospora litoralis TaxID=2498135 RepID=UPI001035F9CB|nr:hypothetical protein [Streptomonospora litoralis]
MRASVAAAAGVMAAGFLDWRAGALVAGLTALTYLLLGTAGRRIPAARGLRPALRALRGGGYRVIREGTARYVAVGPGGVYLLVATRRQAVRLGGRGWRIGGAPAERLAERLSAQAARLDRALASDPAAADGSATAAAMLLVAGPRPEGVADLGGVLLARPRTGARFVLGRDDVLSAEDADRIAERIERHLFTPGSG